ncbi:MAG: VWA domain-containing protein [Actinomycetota bacterium]
MLPILITVVIVAAVLAVVYFIGLQPSKATKEKSARRARTPSGKAAARAAGPKPSPFRQPPAWVRRLPLLLVIAAVVCLVIAVAQFRVAKQKATPVIALVLDSSQSMDAQDVSPSRLVAAQNAAQSFISQLPEDFEVALVTFADAPTVLVQPTADHGKVSSALGTLPRGNGTVIGDGLSAGLDAIEGQWTDTGSGPAAVILLSDGRDTGSDVTPQEAADRAAASEIPVYTVVLGAQGEGDHGANAALLEQIAATTGATSSTAATAGELSGVYESLASQLSSQLQISNSAQLFVFLAIALAMAAAVLLLVLTMSKRG